MKRNLNIKLKTHKFDFAKMNATNTNTKLKNAKICDIIIFIVFTCKHANDGLIVFARFRGARSLWNSAITNYGSC